MKMIVRRIAVVAAAWLFASGCSPTQEALRGRCAIDPVSGSEQTSNSACKGREGTIVPAGGWVEGTKRLACRVAAWFAREYHTSRTWPWELSNEATQSLNTLVDTQAANGRRLMATLWDYHFEQDGVSLSTMGRRRLQQIVENTEVLGPIVYVHAAATADQTQARLESVRTELKRLAGEERQFEVVVSSNSPVYVSGSEALKAVEQMSKKRQYLGESDKEEEQSEQSEQ